MELNTIIEALRATTTLGSQKEAVAYLDETSKMIGFLPLLAKVACSDDLEVPVRQAAVIFYKNGINRAWIVEEDDKKEMTPIAEQDKHVIRREILGHILRAALPIRVHFNTAIKSILRHDYPRDWPDFPGTIAAMLTVEDFNSWMAALGVTHGLTKLFEYRRQQEKQPLFNFMNTVLPLIYARFERCVAGGNAATAHFEHMVLKVFYTLTQFSMDTNLITVEVYGKWIGLMLHVIDCPIDESVNQVSEEERAETYPWKCKKWSMKIIQKLFDRYGAKGQVEKAYEDYAVYYFEHYAGQVIQLILKILQDFHGKVFVSNRYLYFALTHLAEALSHAELWMIVKPHFNELVFHIIFPLLCYSEDDEELWAHEELDFIRERHDCFDELHSPYAAAATVLIAGLKRKGVLDHVLQHFVAILQNPNSSVRDIDGALHVISNMMSKLANSRKYKKDVEKLIAAHIIPRVSHENQFVRLHACYCLKMADEVSFKTERILKDAISTLVDRLKHPNELLAVKIEAGLALNSLLEAFKEKTGKYLKNHVREILTEVFRLLTQITLDELTNIADNIIENFPEEVIPVSVDIATEIHALFTKFSATNNEEDDGDGFDDKSITMIGLLATLQTLLDLVDDSPEISSKLEPIVFDIIRIIYEGEAYDFYEDAVHLVESLICKHISPKGWEFYPLIHKNFGLNGNDHQLTLSEYIGCLYFYLVVDTDEFLRIPKRALMMMEMCEKTLTNYELGSDPHLNAAKLMECFILQCRGRIDQYIPHILQITMNRLQAGHFDDGNNELVMQLLVVLIAAMHYNFNWFVQCLPRIQPYGMETVQWLFAEIFANKEAIEGIHNRKMVLWAICLMLRLPREHQPPAIANHPKTVMELCLDLFEGIEKCLKALADRKKDDDSSDDEDESDFDDSRGVDDELRDSDDDVDEGTLEYLENLSKETKESRKREATAMNPADAVAENIRSDSEDSELYHTFQEETDVESFVTPLDNEEDGMNVYVDFKQCLENLQKMNATQFEQLTAVEGHQAEALKKLFDYCVQQENFVNSRLTARAGGCTFDGAATVPKSFDFSQ